MVRIWVVLVAIIAGLSGCEHAPQEALGTLEWDRVNSRAIQSEVIVEIFVKEGESVKEGTPLLRLDDAKQKAVVEKYEAELQQAIWKEKELVKGPRDEEIAEARARLSAAEANVVTTSLIYDRQKTLRKGDFTSEELLDNARNSFLNAKAQLEERTETLNKLLAGTRHEQLEQARAQVAAIEAALLNARLTLAEYVVTAQRDGRVESIPYKLGDRPTSMSVVCTLLSGEQPWARVYIPEPWRSKMSTGVEYELAVDGQEAPYRVKLRKLEAKSSFTPYFALTERDRSYLSYVAELDFIEEDARALSAGTPVQLHLESK